ncbi:MAG: antitoxin PHD [Spirochaetaceae bacterium]|jgi:PHD/YefM family antitoxin component YafN of YafNO toxin-antitoxin module|nr:antitoxin PHD [Spirochaetaceae bacterium]
MPVIRKSVDLRNHYNEISEFCHKWPEPVFITKNGEGDLAVMSMETYDSSMLRLELYRSIERGLDDIKNGRIVSKEELLANVRKACIPRNEQK